MNNVSVFDEVARILASPMPRRQALRRVIGGLAGAALATAAWPGNARADNDKTCSTDGDCKKNESCCNGTCCPPGKDCCGNKVCCPHGQCKQGKCPGVPSPS